MSNYREMPRREAPQGRDVESGDRELGVRIWRLMLKKGFTQNTLAEASGVSKNVITRLLTGRRMTTFTNIERIATALDVSLDEFRPPSHRPYKGTRADYAEPSEDEVDETELDLDEGVQDDDSINLYR